MKLKEIFNKKYKFPLYDGAVASLCEVAEVTLTPFSGSMIDWLARKHKELDTFYGERHYTERALFGGMARRVKYDSLTYAVSRTMVGLMAFPSAVPIALPLEIIMDELDAMRDRGRLGNTTPKTLRISK